MRNSRLGIQILLCMLTVPLTGINADSEKALHAQATFPDPSLSTGLFNTATGLLIVAIVSFCLGALAVFVLLRQKKRTLSPTETSLSQEEAFLGAVLQSTHDGYIGLSLDGRILEVNDAYCRMSGYTKRELLGMRIRDLEAIDTNQEIAERIGRIAYEGPTFFESAHRRKTGEVFQVELSVTPLRKAPIAMICFCHDISARKQIESALTHFSDLMRYVIEHTRSAIAIHDKNLNYLYVSQRYVAEYRIKDPNIIGKHHYEVFPDLPQKWRDVHQRCLKGEVISADDDIFERADGSIEWTRWECRPWFSQEGEIGGIIVYTEVITDRKLAENRVAEQLQELQRWYQVMLNREDRIIELKKEVNVLLSLLAQAPRYSSTTWENPS